MGPVRVGKLLVRADGGMEMGTGHLMRCFSIAQKWADLGGKATIIKDDRTPEIDRRMCSEDIQVLHYPGKAMCSEDIELVRNESEDAQAIVLDGYHFTSDYCRTLFGLTRMMLIDDLADRKAYHCDVLLNYNTYAKRSDYDNIDSHCDKLLGPRYFPLRREFWKHKGTVRKTREKGKRVLVTMGGSDPHNYTSEILQVAPQMDDIQFDVVIGSTFEETRTSDWQNQKNVFYHRHVSDMSTLMSECDVAISSAGTTTYELAFMGLPSLMISIADNQLKNASSLHKVGTAIDLGWHENVEGTVLRERLLDLLHDSRKRRKMSDKGRSLVDGDGSARICEALLS